MEPVTSKGPYICRRCLEEQESSKTCGFCGDEWLVDSASLAAREAFCQELKGRAQQRRKRFIFVMEAMAIALCVGLLFVGLTVAAGLDSSVMNLAAKVVAVGLLAISWVAIPRVYDGHLRGPEAELLLRLNQR